MLEKRSVEFYNILPICVGGFYKSLISEFYIWFVLVYHLFWPIGTPEMGKSKTKIQVSN